MGIKRNHNSKKRTAGTSAAPSLPILVEARGRGSSAAAESPIAAGSSADSLAVDVVSTVPERRPTVEVAPSSDRDARPADGAAAVELAAGAASVVELAAGAAPVAELATGAAPVAELATGAAPVELAAGAAPVKLEEADHLDDAFFDSAPDSAHWGVEPAAPSAVLSTATSPRRERLLKYVRVAITFSVALCVAALVKAVATRDPDPAPASHSRGPGPSLSSGRTVGQAPPSGGVSRQGGSGRDNVVPGSERSRRPQ